MSTEPLLFPLPDYGHYGCEILAWEATVSRLHAELSALVATLTEDTWCYDSFRGDVVKHAVEVCAPDFPAHRMALKASIIAKACRNPDTFYSSQIRAGRTLADLIKRLQVAIESLCAAQKDRLLAGRAA
jgi:hypothetical protein